MSKNRMATRTDSTLWRRSLRLRLSCVVSMTWPTVQAERASSMLFEKGRGLIMAGASHGIDWPKKWPEGGYAVAQRVVTFAALLKGATDGTGTYALRIGKGVVTSGIEELHPCETKVWNLYQQLRRAMQAGLRDRTSKFGYQGRGVSSLPGTNHSKRGCWGWKSYGTCKRGGSCKFSHDGTGRVAVVEPKKNEEGEACDQEEREPDGKAKALAEAQVEADRAEAEMGDYVRGVNASVRSSARSDINNCGENGARSSPGTAKRCGDHNGKEWLVDTGASVAVAFSEDDCASPDKDCGVVAIEVADGVAKGHRPFLAQHGVS